VKPVVPAEAALQLRPTELVVSEVVARLVGMPIEVALDGAEVTGAPPVGYGLGNAVTVTVFIVVVVTRLV
jgi:hypothetical protein